jgi:hypothetical protein
MWPASKFLVILGLLFAVLAALLAGGVITGSNLGWLLPAAVACFLLSLLVP